MFLVACHVVEDSLPNQELALASSEPGMEDAQETHAFIPTVASPLLPTHDGLKNSEQWDTGFIWATLYSVRCQNLAKT